ncbi:MAG: ABC transporter permease [Candidatus Undinarchaeales archaeon]|jgi:putative ABC transport system permease protein|nr:ABC transporter permease [Candidatus Undinarchaeales archaeon]
MIDLALKDIRSHKLRSFLTALGIIIAITTIVSLGSISSGIINLVEGQLEMVSGRLILQESGQSNMGPPSGKVLLSELEEIEQISGVEATTGIRFAQSGSHFLAGIQLDKMDLVAFDNLEMEEGDWPDAGEYAVVVGFKAREAFGYDMGDYIRVEDYDLEVVGLLEEVGGTMDYGFQTSWETVDDLFPEDEEYTTIAFVKAQDISMLGEIADAIKEEYPHLDVSTAEEQAQQVKESIGTIRAATFGIGFIATLVAMFGIVNTMIMSVSEKKKQIGIMKAVGATRRQIMIRFFEESIIMGLFGSLCGLALGTLGTRALNNILGMAVAKVTIGLATFSVLFAIGVTIIATLYPAIKAAKIDPIKAIRGK